MKKSKRGIAVVLCLVLLASLFAACSGKKEPGKSGQTVSQNQKNPEDSNASDSTDNSDSSENSDASDTAETDPAEPAELKLPLTEETETLSVWTLFTNDYVDEPNDLPGVQKMEEVTNVHIQWTPIGLAELSEKFGLLLASGSIPDLVYAAGMPYPGGDEASLEDGLFLECSGLLEYMPNYQAFLSEHPEYQKDVLTDSGKMAGIFTLNSLDTEPMEERPWSGLALRKDLLDEWGQPIPETVEEWHEVLTVAKEKGIEAPLMTGPNGYASNGAFLTAFGTYPSYYQENGTVKYGPAEPGYREWLELFRDWYAEGLLDKNFISSNGVYPDLSYVASDKALAFQTLHIYTANGYALYGMTENTDINVVAVANPVFKKGDTSCSSYQFNSVVASIVRVSAGCKNPELAAKWMDYQYTPEGMRLNFYGIEGESYELSDGVLAFTDRVLQNPDYPSASAALSSYAKGNSICGYYDLGVELRQNPGANDLFAAAQDTWATQDTASLLPVKITMTQEEGTSYNTINASLSTLVNETTINIIIGAQPIEEYDKMVEKLISYGLEECIGYQQKALDRYQERGK